MITQTSTIFTLTGCHPRETARILVKHRIANVNEKRRWLMRPTIWKHQRRLTNTPRKRKKKRTLMSMIINRQLGKYELIKNERGTSLSVSRSGFGGVMQGQGAKNTVCKKPGWHRR